MGVDFYTCANCSRNFPDCGNYYFCEECSNQFCSNKCADPQPLDEEEGEDENNDENDDDYDNTRYSCCICRKEEANDYILLEALLRHFKISRADALKIWQDEKDCDASTELD
jgi:hypothetical protein